MLELHINSNMSFSAQEMGQSCPSEESLMRIWRGGIFTCKWWDCKFGTCSLDRSLVTLKMSALHHVPFYVCTCVCVCVCVCVEVTWEETTSQKVTENWEDALKT